MTERQITARPVSTFTQGSRAGALTASMRSRQVAGVFKQLGVHFDSERKADFEETAEANAAEANNKARVLAADFMPQIEDAMSRPETYEGQTADDFLKSTTFRAAYDSIENEIKHPEHRKAFLEKYKADMLSRFTKGKSAHEYQKKSQEASIAQQSGAAAGGIKGQMAAYDDAIASGVRPDEAFTSGLAVASLQGADYLKEFAQARTWTPEQQLHVQKTLKAVAKKDKSSASLAYILAGKEQGRTAQYRAYASVLTEHGASLTEAQRANATANLMTLEQELETEGFVRENLGVISTKDMSEGVGLNGGRKIPLSDIQEIHNEEVRTALQSNDLGRLAQLTLIPGDEPQALKDVFSRIIGSLEQADPNNPGSLQALMGVATTIKNTIGSERVRALMSDDNYTLYQELDGIAEFEGLPAAITRIQNAMQLRARGAMPTPADWKPNAVIEYAVGKLADKEWSLFDHDVSQADVRSMLTPFLKQWKTLGLTQDDMEERVDRLVKQSSWNGILNGRLVGERLASITNVDGGNPYDESPEELFKKYNAILLSDIQKTQPAVEGLRITVSPNPSVLVLHATNGIPLNYDMRTLDDMVMSLKLNLKTRKEKVVDERTEHAKSWGTDKPISANWQNIH